MAIIRKEQKEKDRNVLLRVSIPAPLMTEIKKVKRLCKDSGFYFDIKPDVIVAVEKAVEEAKALVDSDKRNMVDNLAESEARTPAQSSDCFLAAAPPEG